METNSPDDTVSPPKEIQTKKIAIMAVFAALVTVTTLLIRIPEPVAGGYFDIGDSIIFITAMLFGQTIGGIAGGIGSMFADIINGAPEYALGTLVIKGMEGFITGYVFSKLKGRMSGEEAIDSRNTMRILLYGTLFSLLMVAFGKNIDSPLLVLWLVLASGMLIAMFFSIFRFKIRSYYLLASMAAGGTVMVFGYMLYYVFGVTFMANLIYGQSAPLINWQGVANSPFDMLQALVCIVIGMILYEALYKSKISEII